MFLILHSLSNCNHAYCHIIFMNIHVYVSEEATLKSFFHNHGFLFHLCAILSQDDHYQSCGDSVAAPPAVCPVDPELVGHIKHGISDMYISI